MLGIRPVIALGGGFFVRGYLIQILLNGLIQGPVNFFGRVHVHALNKLVADVLIDFFSGLFISCPGTMPNPFPFVRDCEILHLTTFRFV